MATLGKGWQALQFIYYFTDQTNKQKAFFWTKGEKLSLVLEILYLTKMLLNFLASSSAKHMNQKKVSQLELNFNFFWLNLWWFWKRLAIIIRTRWKSLLIRLTNFLSKLLIRNRKCLETSSRLSQAILILKSRIHEVFRLFHVKNLVESSFFCKCWDVRLAWVSILFGNISSKLLYKVVADYYSICSLKIVDKGWKQKSTFDINIIYRFLCFINHKEKRKTKMNIK